MASNVQNGFALAKQYKLALALAFAAVLVMAGGTAYSAITTGGGGTITRVVVARGDTATTTTNSAAWVDLPGAQRQISVPAGEDALVTVRFTGESQCTGSAGWCSVRIMAGAIELRPDAGTAFSFDSARSPGDGLESNAMERSRRLPAGTHVIKVQYRPVAGATIFRLDDWHMTVERSRFFA